MVCLLGDSRMCTRAGTRKARNANGILAEDRMLTAPGRPDRYADQAGGCARGHCHGQAVGCGCADRGRRAVEFHRIGAGRSAEVLPLNGYGLSNAALCRAKTKNRQRAGRGRGSCNRKEISDRVVVVGRHIPAWIDDGRQSSQSVINILDGVALRPQRRRNSENEQED